MDCPRFFSLLFLVLTAALSQSFAADAFGPKSSAEIEQCLASYLRSDTEFELPDASHSKSLSGKEIVSLLSQDPDLKKLFDENPGTRDFDTLKAHTLAVLDVFESQAPFSSIDKISKSSKIDLKKLMKLTLGLHDIGKPISAENGDSEQQHAYTTPILRKTLARLGVGEHEIELSSALVDNDVIGDLLQDQTTPEKAYKDLRRLASKTPLSTKDFFELQTLFYTSDAGSYDALRYDFFTEKKGKLTLQDPRFLALQKMIDLAPSKFKEKIEISPEELERAFTPFKSGLVDFDNYQADAKTLKAYRKKNPGVRKYKKYGFAEDYQLAFGVPLPEHPSMTPEELSIIQAYRAGDSDNGHYDWVRALHSRDPAQISEYELEIKVLASALNKLPSYSGKTYRFVTLPASAVERYKKGTLVFEPAFTSSSVKRRDLENDSSNIFFVFHLHSQGGHNIDFEGSAESEVLINANTPFKVVSVEKTVGLPGDHFKSEKEYTVIEMSEVPKSDLGLKEPAHPKPFVAKKVKPKAIRKIKIGRGVPNSLWSNGKDRLYFEAGNKVQLSGRDFEDVEGSYSIKGSKIIISLPQGGPLVLERKESGALIGPNGAEFVPE